MTPRDRRALLMGASLVAAAVLGLRVAPWSFRTLFAWRARVADARATLAREQALLASAPQLQDSLDRALARVVALAPAVVAGRTSAEASATLASWVTLGASRHALKVVSVNPLPDSATGVFDRVAVHVALEGDVRGLTSFLAAVETGVPLLTVGQLTVDAPTPAGPRSAPEALEVGLTVAGYALVRSAP